MSKTEIIAASGTSLPTSPRALRKAIFDALHPEQVARSLPAQALYNLVREAGVTSSLDLLALADLEQFRTMLDLDLWRGDELNEEAFWEWLSLVEEEDDFSLLQRVLKSIDLKLVGLMLGTYIDVITYDEGNDEPPAKGFYTPDKGHTWIHIKIQEPNKHFLLARFLALIFETSKELFYQLIAVPTVSTRSQLEEESYQERNKRLEAHGVPTNDFAYELLSPLSVAELTKLIKTESVPHSTPDVRPVPILHHTINNIEPLDSVFRAALTGLEEEFTLLANANLVKHQIDFNDREAVQRVTAQLLGAINIGLERALQEFKNSDAVELAKKIGLRPFARCGFALLESLRKTASKLSEESLKQIDPQAGLFLVVAGARELPPLFPVALKENGTFETTEGQMLRDYRAFRYWKEVQQVSALLPKK